MSNPLSTAGPLAGQIRREIEAAGPISLARFMEQALYAPGLGYYEQPRPIPGRRGDFYTSVSVGSLFGELLAFQFAAWMAAASPLAGGSFQIVEAGAHDGRLAADLLEWLRLHRPEIWAGLEYWIVEPSERRLTWQERTLAPFRPRVRWTEATASLPPAAFRIHFSNELLDAMPVHRLGWNASAKRWFEWGVGWNGARFVWERMALSPELEAGRLDSTLLCGPRLPPELEAVLPDGYTVEVALAAQRWWREAAAALGQGRLLAFDYGLTEEELFQPERAQGTLRSYAGHRSSADVLADPGLQDLTAHVPFTPLQRAGEEAGLRTEGLFSQARFLTSVAGRVWAAPDSFGPWTPERTRQFQTLTHPEHLGSAFRVLVQAA